MTNRKLNEYDTFVRFKEAVSVIKKVQSRETEFYNERVSSQKPFGLRTYVKPTEAVCTETYIVIDCFDTEQEAQNLMGYLKTRFVRFLVAQLATTQHLSKAAFGFVPVQDFKEDWTDEKLYKKYELTEDEIAFVESTIRVME